MIKPQTQSRNRVRRHVGGVASKVVAWSLKASNPRLTALAPLTPRFDPTQHQTYVDHLNDALEDRKIRNIALTGRYGSGKSSVLEEFARHWASKERILFLSLSTLGPSKQSDPGADEGITKTNQIQKELVKQLLHREKPARLPQSRYHRIERLSPRKNIAEVVAALLVVGMGLWLFGIVPTVPGLESELPLWVRIGAAVLTGCAAVKVLTSLRLAVHNRLVVSEVSAAGGSIKLTGNVKTYFDQYLDEIVYFFESTRSDVVVFEDLDRFDDPGIFESLRELNTLLNNSKQMGKRTIRFVYALRDSIFDRDIQCQHLGETTEKNFDAAGAETERANRTKFFDLVIPIVPFITHRNSRDLLSQLLVDQSLAPVPLVSAGLINLTARYIPDMRLLTNIRNEYAVFSKLLITEKRGVKSLQPDQLFALVVYKNIHLADFELLRQGRSQLDTVYQLSRKLVAQSINDRKARLPPIAG
jgi:KAP family P-loop domain